MIVFISRSAAGCNPGAAENEWLPRQCPSCGAYAVIGHGRRGRQSNDEAHDRIRVRRGICKVCRRTLTVLPASCIPGAQYGLSSRRQALAAVAEGSTLEQAAPHCQDPNRMADASTIRRWGWRRIESLQFWWGGLRFRWGAPTLFAWDWRAAARSLITEPISP